MITREERDRTFAIAREYEDKGIVLIAYCRNCKERLKHLEKERLQIGYVCPCCGREWSWQ